MDVSPAKCEEVSEVSSPSLRNGVLALLASGTSTQVGAAVGAHAFPLIGPAGVVAVRQLVAAAVLLPIARPQFRRLTWAQWWPTLLLGLVFTVMNLSLYMSIDRIGLGLAVTLEVLGPLAVALLTSHRLRDIGIAVAAGVGVYVLVLPDGSTDMVGIGLGLLAAVCWALYILLNRTVGRRLCGLQAPAIASTIAAIIYLPVIVTLAAQGAFTGMALVYALGAGVLSSAVPYATDLMVLRVVPPHLFGVLMSAQPGLAALAGILLLGQIPSAHEWAGIVIIAAANATAVLARHRERRGSRPLASRDHQDRQDAPLGNQGTDLDRQSVVEGIGVATEGRMNRD
jgi:inner membrane transporter RhtA